MNKLDVFNPFLSNKNRERHISKEKKNILDSFNDGNDKFIDLIDNNNPSPNITCVA